VRVHNVGWPHRRVSVCVCGGDVTAGGGGGGGSGGTNRKRRAMGRIACLPPVSSRFLYLSIFLLSFFGVDSFNPYRASVVDLSLDRDLCPGPHHQRAVHSP
jgi:hypothetical protein